MTTSGTYTFNPSNGEIVLAAYARCKLRRTQLLLEHMMDARNECNLLLSEWSNLQVNLFKVDLVTQVLVPGIATYPVDPNTVMILDAYIQTGDDPPIDRIIMPISRTEYASFTNKVTPGFPTVFWFDRLINPTITLWQPPDDQQIYTLKYYRCIQMMDAGVASGQTLDVPYRWLDAFVWGLAARLAQIYAPEEVDRLDAKAQRSWNIAATQDVENVPMSITPGMSGYWRP